MRAIGGIVASLALGAAVAAQVPSPQGPAAPSVKVTARARYDIAAGLHSMFTAGYGYNGVGGDFVTVARKGQRFAVTWRPGTQPAPGPPVVGEVVDLGTQVMYRISFERREYIPWTFADLHNSLAGLHRAGDQIQDLRDGLMTEGPEPPAQSRSRAKRFDYSVEVKQTGERRVVAGFEAREVAIDIRAWDRTKSLEDGGGWTVAHHVWLSARVPAIDSLVALERDYARAISKGAFDTAFTLVELPNADRLDPEFPELVTVAARVNEETAKLDGTVLFSSTTYDLARSAKEMKSALQAEQAKLRSQSKPVPQDLAASIPRRVRIAALELEYLTIDLTAADADVAIPEWFTLYRKK